MKHLYYLLILIFSVFVISTPLFSEIYEWTDENGVRHFGNANPEEDTEVKVIEELEHDKQAHEENLQKRNESHQNYLREQREKKAERERELREAESLRQQTEENKKDSIAYDNLKKLDSLVSSTINWTEYQALLSDAKLSLDRIENNSETRNLLFEAYSCYALAKDMWMAHNANQKKRLRKMYDQIKKDWGKEANTYWQGRRLCWQRANEKLGEYKKTHE